MIDERTMRLVLGGGMLAAMAVGLIVAVRWRLSAGGVPVIPPPRRHRFVPWSGAEMCLALLLNWLFPLTIMVVLRKLGILDRAKEPDEFTGAALFIYVLALTSGATLAAIAIPAALWAGSGTRLRHLGLSRWRWKPSLYLAFVMYVIITPIVLGLNLLAYELNQRSGAGQAFHPFQRLAETYPGAMTWFLIVLSAVVIAPLAEELLLRGVMLPWLSRQWWGGWAAMGAGIAMGFLVADRHRAPLAFALVVSLVGIAMTFPHAGEQWARRAIIGTSVFFAMFHVSVWPTPIPLLVLGLALGWARHRTRSLIVPILLHAMFNATAVLMMMIGVKFDGK